MSKARHKVPGYREAVAWVALNDNAGDREAYDVQSLHGYVTVGMVADLFGRDQLKVAYDVVKYRIALNKSTPG